VLIGWNRQRRGVPNRTGGPSLAGPTNPSRLGNFSDRDWGVLGDPYQATVALIGGRATLTTSALGEGSHTVVAVYNGDANFATSTSTTTTITCTNTVTGNHPGALIVNSGSVCVLNARVGGAIVVAKGASIDVENSTIASITANSGPRTIRVCATAATGAVSVSGATGLVIIGDPGDAACRPQQHRRHAHTLQPRNNTGGSLVASNNSGPGPFPGDTTTITGNHR
jgi:hypothetical protein